MKIDDYLKTYHGVQLLKKYNLSDIGIWEIRGEDPNCDMLGKHDNPYLGTIEGTLQEATEWAVNQNGFWQWGAGGKIKRIVILKSEDIDGLEEKEEIVMEHKTTMEIKLTADDIKNLIVEHIKSSELLNNFNIKGYDIDFNIIERLGNSNHNAGFPTYILQGVTCKIDIN